MPDQANQVSWTYYSLCIKRQTESGAILAATTKEVYHHKRNAACARLIYSVYYEFVVLNIIQT